MRVTFYGVRGSIPTPGAAYIKYGGNTACVHVELNDGTDIILDSGTGIRLLGNKLKNKTSPIHLLLSHNHWDHIQGFPFFSPIYQANRDIFIYPGQTSLAQHDHILQQMEGSFFPVSPCDLHANIQFKTLPENQMSWQIGNAKIKRLRMNHPGKGSAYCLEEDGVKLAYITDNELYPPYQKETNFLGFVDFAKDADMIIHDAQYLASDMPDKSGWGHSVAEEAVKLALACQAKHLALYSHDPDRTDKDIDMIVEHCEQYITVTESALAVFASAEGQTLIF
ncbi:MBL fold metallo-hydrolase [Alteromonas australica]|uniref:MBL fold metallo-hydrolase n=1 Tax=Alteromonas australica TaxID=589873 RepID=UPI002353B70E|nr:MBL fold metallo-hydrolase [Alteromonas australica]|tara:strand:- start:1568 stop:2407 length:840 start_codon:yes stop_codon:yes gene_type:complete